MLNSFMALYRSLMFIPDSLILSFRYSPSYSRNVWWLHVLYCSKCPHRFPYPIASKFYSWAVMYMGSYILFNTVPGALSPWSKQPGFYLILPPAVWVWGWHSLEQKCIYWIFLGGKAWSACKANTFCELSVWKVWDPQHRTPFRPVLAVTGTALLLLL
jgi:hypothetical protein